MSQGLQTPKVYLDTNILISYQVGREKDPKYFPLAQDVFRQIIVGKYIGVVSFVTLMEAVNVFRRIKTEELKELGITDPDKQTEYVKNESTFLYQQLTRKLLEAQRNLRLEDCKGVSISSFLSTSLEISQNYSGVVKTYNDCRQCKSNIPHNVHKAIGALDIIHIFIARGLKCKYLITFDKGFKQIINDERIKPLEVRVME